MPSIYFFGVFALLLTVHLHQCSAAAADIFKHRQRYNLSNIEGWFIAEDTVFFLLHTLALYDPNGLQSVVEIGVYQGKSLISMLDSVPASIPVVALDLFEGLQEFNYDHAGSGSAVAVQKNLEEYYESHPRKRGQVVLKAGDSTKMSATDVLASTNSKLVSFFSVDGCHTVKCTLSDLRLAYSVLANPGIIMVDDYFNRAWPGVSLAVGVFLEENKKELAGILYGENKFYIVRHSDLSFWKTKIIAHFEPIEISVHNEAGVSGDDLIEIVR